jgi:hypothetical protein
MSGVEEMPGPNARQRSNGYVTIISTYLSVPVVPTWSIGHLRKATT